MDPDSGLPTGNGKTKIEGGRLENVTLSADSQCTGCGEISDWRSVGEVEKRGEEGGKRKGLVTRTPEQTTQQGGAPSTHNMINDSGQS